MVDSRGAKNMKSLLKVTSLLWLISANTLLAQTPSISRVVDAASFGTQLAPGSLANIIGANFGSSTAISVIVGGKACAVLAASPSQLQIQIAIDAPLGPTTIQVGASAPLNISLAQYAPVLFSADGSGHGNVQAYHAADGSLVTPSSPSAADEIILMFAIGMGPTNPAVPTGTVSPSIPPAPIATAVTAMVADKAALVVFAGLAPGKIGVYQINFIVPADISTGDQPISLNIGGVVTNALTLPTTDAPVVTGLQNNYSYITAGLPNYGIAQGSIFAIYGSNLASANTPLQTSYPLRTSLEGVSVSVTVNGVTTHPILYYVTRDQLGAILPSSTPVGSGQIIVTKNGEPGLPAPIQVVQSAFGLLTLNQAGSGPAVALDASFHYLGLTNSIQPGEYVNFWGSGLGPAAGDETGPQTPVELANIPIEVDIGGLPAQVTYHGRSIYPGFDQVQVIVPATVLTGCNVPVVVRTGNISSNFATIPVAASGRTCSEPELGITSNQLQSALSKSSFTLGTINFQESVNGSPQGAPEDVAGAQFTRFLTSQFSAANLGQVSLGTCMVYYDGEFGGNGGDPLDAGPSININSPIGKAELDPSGDGDGSYGEFLGSATAFPVFIPTAGGALNFDNAAGGADVQAFMANLTLGNPLVWSNEAAVTTISRSNGLTITWTGGAANSYVRISGMSGGGTPPFGFHTAFFTCAAPANANQFTVPASVLLALPPTGPNAMFSTLSVSNNYGQLFIAPGLDLGLVTASVNFSTTVTYQ
jgi:uncharacterized protein (TIGR03437 family)